MHICNISVSILVQAPRDPDSIFAPLDPRPRGCLRTPSVHVWGPALVARSIFARAHMNFVVPLRCTCEVRGSKCMRSLCEACMFRRTGVHVHVGCFGARMFMYSFGARVRYGGQTYGRGSGSPVSPEGLLAVG